MGAVPQTRRAHPVVLPDASGHPTGRQDSCVRSSRIRTQPDRPHSGLHSGYRLSRRCDPRTYRDLHYARLVARAGHCGLPREGRSVACQQPEPAEKLLHGRAVRVSVDRRSLVAVEVERHGNGSNLTGEPRPD